MTALVVVDASALAAIAFKEPAGRDIRDRLANTALTKLRRHPTQATIIRTGLARVLSDVQGHIGDGRRPGH